MSGLLPQAPHIAGVGQESTPASRIPALVREVPHGFRAFAGDTLEATVAGVNRQGHLMLRSPHGTIALATSLRPPIGSQVTLQFRPAGSELQAYILKIVPAHGGAAEGRGVAAAGTGAADTPATLTRVWPALEAALAASNQPAAAGAGRTAAPAALADAVPQPGPRLGSSLLFLMSALNRGDLGSWIGRESLAALRRLGRDDLAGRLEGDFSRLQGFARPGDGGEDFRLFVLPVLIEGAVQPVRFFLHGPEDAAEPDTPRRFVVETELPMLGELQLDGLTRPGRLDLILRSREELAGSLQDELRGLVAEAAARGGFAGEIEFTANDRWHFRSEPEEGRHGVVV